MFQKNALLSFLLSASLLGRPSSAATTQVEWIISLDPNTGTATVGDSVVFNFRDAGDTADPFHNVYIHKDATCDTAGSIFVTDEPGGSYTFTADDVGEVVFACQIVGHCDAGQLMTFTVSAAPPPTTPSPTLAPTPAPTEKVTEGESDETTSPASNIIMSSGLVAAAIGFALV